MDDNDLGLGNEVRGRIFHMTAYGDNASEIEIAALVEAQAFFGDDVPLEVVQDYMVSKAGPSDLSGGKKYAAGVSVRAIVQG